MSIPRSRTQLNKNLQVALMTKLLSTRRKNLKQRSEGMKEEVERDGAFWSMVTMQYLVPKERSKKNCDMKLLMAPAARLGNPCLPDQTMKCSSRNLDH